MPFPRGRHLALSAPRRLICDLMYFSRGMPLVSLERRLELRAVVEARQALAERPSWLAIFLKAYGDVARRRPPLRHCYLPLPWPHIHEHACNVATIPVERRLADEDAVLFLRVREPESRSLWQLHQIIRAGKSGPIEGIGSYRNALRVSRLPLPLRRLAWWIGLRVVPHWRARYFGTFGITSLSSFGAAPVHFPSPLTSTLTYGIFAADGSIEVRLVFDHRVLDGVEPACALQDLERTLNGPILAELRSLQTRAA
jgi:hypothetical protein